MTKQYKNKAKNKKKRNEIMEKYKIIIKSMTLIILLITTIYTIKINNSYAQQHQIHAVVNDIPITEYDIQQQLKIMKMMGNNINEEKKARKKALDQLISQELKKWEAQRLDVKINQNRINNIINTSENLRNLREGLKKQGVSIKRAEDFIKTNILWNEIVKRRFGTRKANPKKVQQLYDKLKNDPAMKTTILYNLKRILIPIQKQTTPEMTRQILYNGLVNARTIIQKGGKCSELKETTKAMPNIRLEPNVEVPVSELDPQLKAALEKENPGKILGPILVENDSFIMLLAYCGKRTFQPPTITKEVIENRLLSQKYEILSQRYLNELKQVGLVEYR